MPPTHRLIQLAFLVLVTALASPASVSAETVVTSLTGDVKSGDGPLAAHAVVPEGETFETEDDGHCSLMIADEAVVQLCNAATVTVSNRGNARVLSLKKGELKARVGPRSADQPLEIHTPAAIATLMGTVVHVSVDPDTGETTITSVEDRIRVQGVEDDRLNPVVLEPGQQVTIRPGEAPGEVRTLSEVATGAVSDCMLSDEELRLLAVAGARAKIQNDALTEIASVDIPNLSTPAVSAAFENIQVIRGIEDGAAVDPLLRDPPPCDPVQCGGAEPGRGSGSQIDEPKSCGGRAGDHCQF